MPRSLYRHDRMENLAWAEGYEAMGTGGWMFGYAVLLFHRWCPRRPGNLAGYVTPVTDYRLGMIGTIEAVVSMQNLFPGFYENAAGEWGCFVAEDGTVYYGSNYTEEAETLQEKIWESVQQEYSDTDGGDSFAAYYKMGGSKLTSRRIVRTNWEARFWEPRISPRKYRRCTAPEHGSSEA